MFSTAIISPQRTAEPDDPTDHPAARQPSHAAPLTARNLCEPVGLEHAQTIEEVALMRRIIGVLTGTLAIGLSIASVAQAAATPVAATGHAQNITTTTAVLRGHVNPNGVGTDYTFNYGLTPSYGTTTVARSAGSGSKLVVVQDRIAGLQPGTTYHFQIAAVSAAGSASGADVTFTTAGRPPSQVDTGPAVAIGKEQAGITGTIDPNGAPTTWYIQYGLTTAYGVQTDPQTLAAGTTAVPVSTTLTGLAPARLFHYRIVAYHGAVVSYGADATFFTRPDNPAPAGLRTKITPGSDAKAPYTFTTSGSLVGGRYIPASDRCTGTVGIRYYNGRHQLAYVVADVGSDCTFSGKASFRKTGDKGKVKLRVTVSYRTNGYLAPEHKTDHVTVGK
jgi:hypothetical protein